MKFKLKSVGLVLAGAFAGILVSVGLSAVAQRSQRAVLPLEELRQFSDVFGAIKANYVEPVEDKKLIQEAISGMVTGLELVIVRPPLVYGPGVGGNFARMVRWLRRGVPLPLGQATANRRSLVALDNLVDLLATCLAHPAAAGETFLVSDGEDLSTTELLRRLATALDLRARLLPVPPVMLQVAASALGRGELAQRLLGSLQVDMAATQRVLQWQPVLTVDEALRQLSRTEVA